MYSFTLTMPKNFSKDVYDGFHQMLFRIYPILGQLGVGFRVLAAISIIWCAWSWRTESRIAALVATVFVILAIFCAVFMVPL